VIAYLKFFNSGSEKVVVKPGERSISRAVDSVELLRRAFVKRARLFLSPQNPFYPQLTSIEILE